MTDPHRRHTLKLMLAGAAAPLALKAAAIDNAATRPAWRRGIEQQRQADAGNGTYRNPILAGDHPDPTILKDGRDYYMTFSPFSACPGLLIWHSTDLVNWTPVVPALTKPIGSVWAVDLCKHNGRYFIYLPAAPEGKPWSIYAIWADRIEGPWSEPIDLNIPGCIDPGHVVGEDGKRYLFVNGIRKVRLSDDGLSTDGPLEQAYNAWRYPDDWVVETFAPEGPKLLKHGEWFYLVTAVGGTAGPPTGHMVIAARSKSVHGPWEHCPHNPLVRTKNADEPWWSRGHASLVEGPAGDWWMVYHGYENGFRTLGRQTLLEPIEWTGDGWFRALGGDLSKPLPKPKGGRAGADGMALSGPFSVRKLGMPWSFHDATPTEMQRVRDIAGGGMRLAAQGQSPADSTPLVCTVGDRSYEAELVLELDGKAEGGLLLFYNPKAFVGIGFTPDTMKMFEYAQEHPWIRQAMSTSRVHIRLTNDNHVVTWHYSHDDGRTWVQHPMRMEVSGIHHNVFGGFLALKIGIYSANEGSVVLREFRYRALDASA
ncbi:family 43 glycosylhydrolase [Dyella marensis]|uniref:Xylan 1,4-beta-xylosidase n=1 Tax=Dyella marensis TaxID=500610 RepID=A0A1I2C5Q7_9GAMM|nr:MULTISPECIES: family 43 glycosylhydrolase [Dyella]SFE63634.1 xylan 1,4-beta-xylosidase [Dyella marensis]